MRAGGQLDILGVRVDAVDLEGAVDRLLAASAGGSAGYVCVTGVHGIMECRRDGELRAIHNRSLLTVPDGMPLVVLGRRRGFGGIGRVYGPDLMLRLLERTEHTHSHFFCGATEETLHLLEQRLAGLFPGLRVVGRYAPGFGPVSGEETGLVVGLLKRAQPDFVWVGMSTPKQERFMAVLHEAGAGGVFLGVGAAFDLHAHGKPDAPGWMRRLCLHWLFRLCRDPRRLWRRYLRIVPGFLWALLLEKTCRRCAGKTSSGSGG